MRLLVQSLLHGETVYDPEWRRKMSVPGILITDAKSLYDYLNTTGKIPKERQIMIDLLVARAVDLVRGTGALLGTYDAHTGGRASEDDAAYGDLREVQG